MSTGIYDNLSSQEIVMLAYLSSIRSWGITPNDSLSISPQTCCDEITWDTLYDNFDTTNKVWGISYYQKK